MFRRSLTARIGAQATPGRALAGPANAWCTVRVRRDLRDRLSLGLPAEANVLTHRRRSRLSGIRPLGGIRPWSPRRHCSNVRVVITHQFGFVARDREQALACPSAQLGGRRGAIYSINLAVLARYCASRIRLTRPDADCGQHSLPGNAGLDLLLRALYSYQLPILHIVLAAGGISRYRLLRSEWPYRKRHYGDPHVGHRQDPASRHPAAPHSTGDDDRLPDERRAYRFRDSETARVATANGGEPQAKHLREARCW